MALEAEALMSPVTIVQTLSLLTAHYIELIVASFWTPQIHGRGVPQSLSWKIIFCDRQCAQK